MTQEINHNVDDESKKLFTAGFEAFIVTQMDNNYDRWCARVRHYQQEGNWDAKLPDKVRKTKGVEENPENPCWDAKYSIDDAGRESYVTWKEDGLEFFQKTYSAIAKERKVNGKDYVLFEAKFLAYLQQKHRGTATNASKKGNKRCIWDADPKAAQEKNKKRASLVMEQQDEGDLEFDDTDDLLAQAGAFEQI